MNVDTTRASRDGHEYHEAWAARLALQLLRPEGSLVGIAVEGLHPADHRKASSEVVEIADLVLYYGRRPTFRGARSVEIVQLKYSISRAATPFRASDAKKTIAKFASAYRYHIKEFGAAATRRKLRFELVTNRPVLSSLDKAMRALASGSVPKGHVAEQARQIRQAAALPADLLSEFAARVRFAGSVGSLRKTKEELERTIVDWSATSDALAFARLGDLRQMIRDKAGDLGEGRNLVRATDVMAALRVAAPEDLCPLPPSTVTVKHVVERTRTSDAIRRARTPGPPLLIHAAGGVGKTVFLGMIRERLEKEGDCVVYFDCFGGGAYRSPEDARHKPERAILQIVNDLAFRGLCDPLLPSEGNVEQLLAALRRRFGQAVETIRRKDPDAHIVLVMDAIDNSAIQAESQGESSFPKLLLSSLEHSGSIAGVLVVMACRSERVQEATAGAACRRFELQPFIRSETEAFLRSQRRTISATQIGVAQARSGGNARILAYLLEDIDGLADDGGARIELSELLGSRVSEALADARRRGTSDAQINDFLAGLAVLPLPIPIRECASACGLAESSVESFASDLAPLVERTAYGLMLKDEPTETFVRDRYVSDESLLRVANNLDRLQEESVFAARALPRVLQQQKSHDRLFSLAFDDRIPASVTGEVGKRSVRLARIHSALSACLREKDAGRLVELLVELSRLSATDIRGLEYIFQAPDLAIAANDADAIRRLFEARSAWPGTRHGRLTIANVLSGNLDEAGRHAARLDEWLRHYLRQHSEERAGPDDGPDHIDAAAIPLYLIARGEAQSAARSISHWYDWYQFRVGETLFDFLEQGVANGSISRAVVSEFVRSRGAHGGRLASAACSGLLAAEEREEAISRVARFCQGLRKAFKAGSAASFRREAGIRHGLRVAAGMAVSKGDRAQARAILNKVPDERPSLWSFGDRFDYTPVVDFVVGIALRAAARERAVLPFDLLPEELFNVVRKAKRSVSDEEARRLLADRLEKQADESRALREDRAGRERFLSSEWKRLLAICRILRKILDCESIAAGSHLSDLVEALIEGKRSQDPYGRRSQPLTEGIGPALLEFVIRVRTDLAASSIKSAVEWLRSLPFQNPSCFVEVVDLLARRPDLHELAGEEAVRVNGLIKRESDVTTRAELYAELARAVLPVSSEEAAQYFRMGLEQMDAIGSGDYEFAAELMGFAAKLPSDPLEEPAFHTLTNICELNIPEDSEKFAWLDFARATSRLGGAAVLSKISRWDHRGLAPLRMTLLPCLTALIHDEHIDTALAVVLNELAEPLEYGYGSGDLGSALVDLGSGSGQFLEFLEQFEQNNRGLPALRALEVLPTLADRVFDSPEVGARLAAARDAFERVRREQRVTSDAEQRARSKGESSDSKERRAVDRREFRKIRSRLRVFDASALEAAIGELRQAQLERYDEDLVEFARSKLEYRDREAYIEWIASSGQLRINQKLNELGKCKEAWARSSASLGSSFLEAGRDLLHRHADDLISFGHLSVSRLEEIAELSRLPVEEVVFELIEICASDETVPGSIWFALATRLLEESTTLSGRRAVERLLASDAASLADTVADGGWRPGMYPSGDAVDAASGLMWRMLGAPKVGDRWRGAHSIVRAAKLGRWDVIEALVARLDATEARPFAAPELPFFHMHARLWLLIGLARAAIDCPRGVAQFYPQLRELADLGESHVLVRHFAAQAVVSCVDRGGLTIGTEAEAELKGLDGSPFAVSDEERRHGGSFYRERPEGAAAPDPQFHLDYYFDKEEVHSLAEVFDIPGYEVGDLISAEVVARDPEAENMSGGGTVRYPNYDLSEVVESHGWQLGWHCLFIVAGRLLADRPVVKRPYDGDDPWVDWLGHYTLTRSDGRWLADGVDPVPLETIENLLESAAGEQSLTGKKAKLRPLVDLEGGDGRQFVVDGGWASPDRVRVSVSSALVPSKGARSRAKALVEEEPPGVWLPILQQHDEELEHSSNEKDGYQPWVVSPYKPPGLDERDPLGSSAARWRPYFSSDVVEELGLSSEDPFGRVWQWREGEAAAWADAWGQDGEDRYSRLGCGNRLRCSADMLKELLGERECDLVVLISLSRYVERTSESGSSFFYTTAALRISRTLRVEYFPGQVNFHYQAR